MPVKMIRTYAYSVLYLSLGLLMSCGGGGGDSDNTTTTPQGQAVPPKITMMSPMSGAENVSVLTEIELVLDKSAGISFEATQKFSTLIFNGWGVPGKVTINAGGTIIRFVPDIILPGGQTYEIDFSQEPTLSQLPNAILDEAKWSFTTQTDTWSDTTQINRANAPGSLNFLSISADYLNNGQAVVVWRENNYEFWFNQFDGSAWQDAAKISSTEGIDSGVISELHVRMTDSGYIYVAWRRDNDIWLTVHDGNTWSVAEKMNTVEVGQFELTIIGSDVLLMWVENYNVLSGEGNVWVRRHKASTGWEPEKKHFLGFYRIQDVSFQIDQNHNLWAAWSVASELYNDRILTAILSPDDTWSSTTQLSDDLYANRRPEIEVIDSNNAFAAWRANGDDMNDTKIHYSVYQNGAWLPSEALPSDKQGKDSLSLQAVSADATGKIALSWSFSNVGQPGYQYWGKQFSPVQGWSDDILLNDSEAVISSANQLGYSDKQGNILLAWEQSYPSQSATNSAIMRHSFNNGWSPKVEYIEFGQSSGIGRQPVVVFSERGALVVWKDLGAGESVLSSRIFSF